MSITMTGIEVANEITKILQKRVESLRKEGISPCLGIIRVGEREDDLAYERGAMKRMEKVGIETKVLTFPETISQKDFEEASRSFILCTEIDGILLFRPLPKHLQEEPIKEMLEPRKDADCMTTLSMAKIFLGDEKAHAPCTSEAVMEMLSYYDIDVEGKNVVIIGRSMVVGKPLSMLLLKANATVTVCHTKTKNMAAVCKEADILIAAAGVPRMVKKDWVKEGAVVVDVGINVDEEGKLCGDVAFDEVAKVASHISPVPRGVGSITSSILARNVVESAANRGV